MMKFIDIGEAKEKLRKEKVEDIRMCELFDDIREEGRVVGEKAGKERGAKAIVNLLHRKCIWYRIKYYVRVII